MRYSPPSCRAVAALVVSLSLSFLASPARAQLPDTAEVARGVVQRTDGTPLPRATVYLLETLESAATDSAGRFRLRAAHRGVATLVVRGVGFRPLALDVDLPIDSALTLTLERQPAVLSGIAVIAAGEYTIGTAQSSTLTPLEVVQTPGAAGSVSRAIQTLPGVQGVDEGTGLFVRGGDVTETRVLIDDAWVISPFRFDNPTGHVTSTVNPFLLQRTVFTAGAFGARYGNALSGMIRMETADAPTRPTASLTASVGGATAAGAVRLHDRLAVRGSAGVSNLSPLFAVFGEAQPFAPAPRGGDASLSAEWKSGRAGRVRWFGVQQQAEFGVGAATPVASTADGPASDRYLANTTETMHVLSWRDSSTAWRPAVTAAWSGFSRDESTGAFALRTQLRSPQLVASLGYVTSSGARATAGIEHEQQTATYRGDGADRATPLFDITSRSTRRAVFGEWQQRVAERWTLTTGVRSDASTLTGRRTVDPRIGIAGRVGPFGFSGAWGRYHQVAEPTFNRASDFAPMRADQWVAGVQVGGDTVGLRLETYGKRYRDLWQMTPDFEPVGGGRGSAHGVDLQLRWRFSGSSRSRLAWSSVRSRRTDPVTGLDAPALADITHSFSWITDRTWRFLTVSTALRHATGRPFTDIVGTTVENGITRPVNGAPFGARLPGYWRSDLSMSWFRPLGAQRAMVLWGSASNLFDRQNVMRYRWSPDYRERLPVQAPFNRSVFLGITLLL